MFPRRYRAAVSPDLGKRYHGALCGVGANEAAVGVSHQGVVGPITVHVHTVLWEPGGGGGGRE